MLPPHHHSTDGIGPDDVPPCHRTAHWSNPIEVDESAGRCAAGNFQRATHNGWLLRSPNVAALEAGAVFAHQLHAVAAAGAHLDRAAVADAGAAAHALFEQHLQAAAGLRLAADGGHRLHHHVGAAGEGLVAPLEQFGERLRDEAFASGRPVVGRDDDLDLRRQQVRREDLASPTARRRSS